MYFLRSINVNTINTYVWSCYGSYCKIYISKKLKKLLKFLERAECPASYTCYQKGVDLPPGGWLTRVPARLEGRSELEERSEESGWSTIPVVIYIKLNGKFNFNSKFIYMEFNSKLFMGDVWAEGRWGISCWSLLLEWVACSIEESVSWSRDFEDALVQSWMFLIEHTVLSLSNIIICCRMSYQVQ